MPLELRYGFECLTKRRKENMSYVESAACHIPEIKLSLPVFSWPSTGKDSSAFSCTFRIFFHKTAFVRSPGSPVITKVRVALGSVGMSSCSSCSTFGCLACLGTRSSGAGYLAVSSWSKRLVSD